MPALGVPLWLFALALGGCSNHEADVSRYVTARAAHVRAWDSLWAKGEKGRFENGDFDPAYAADSAFVREYSPLLRRIIAPLEMPGLADSGRMSMGQASGPYDNTDAPDGFLYRTADSVEVFVGDTTIFRASLTRNGDPADGSLVALREPVTFVWMFKVEADGYMCADLQVTSASKRLYRAMAVEYSQDQDDKCTPDWVVVGVVAGRRVLAAQKHLSDTTRLDVRRLTGIAQALVDRLPSR